MAPRHCYLARKKAVVEHESSLRLVFGTIRKNVQEFSRLEYYESRGGLIAME